MAHGGQQPLLGAVVQLYAAGTGGYGTAATPLLPTSGANVVTTSDGSGIGGNAQLAIAPDASCFMPIASLPFFILSLFMVPFFMVSFDMLSLDIASFDIASFDIESLDIAPLACANAAPPLVRNISSETLSSTAPRLSAPCEWVCACSCA